MCSCLQKLLIESFLLLSYEFHIKRYTKENIKSFGKLNFISISSASTVLSCIFMSLSTEFDKFHLVARKNVLLLDILKGLLLMTDF